MKTNFIQALSELHESDAKYSFKIEKISDNFNEWITEVQISSIVEDVQLDLNLRFNAFYLRLYNLRRVNAFSKYSLWFERYKSIFQDYKYIKVFEGNCLRFEFADDPVCLEKAISLFEEVLADYPDHIGVKRNLASTILGYCELMGYDDEKINYAIQITEDAIQSNLQYHKYYHTMSQLLLFKDDFKGALKNIRLAKSYCEPGVEMSEYISLENRIRQEMKASNKIRSTSYQSKVVPNTDNKILQSVKYVDISNHQFDIAFSFPGEARSIVEPIVNEIDKIAKPDSYFYDNNYLAQLARPELATLLQDLYGKRASLIVVFVSGDYQRKTWCGIEFRAIKEIIYQRDFKRVMYIRVGDGDVEGIFPSDGYIDAEKYTPHQIAQFIHQRLLLLGN